MNQLVFLKDLNSIPQFGEYIKQQVLSQWILESLQIYKNVYLIAKKKYLVNVASVRSKFTEPIFQKVHIATKTLAKSSFLVPVGHKLKTQLYIYTYINTYQISRVVNALRVFASLFAKFIAYIILLKRAPLCAVFLLRILGHRD